MDGFVENCIEIGIFDASVLVSGDIGIELLSPAVYVSPCFPHVGYRILSPSSCSISKSVAKRKALSNASRLNRTVKVCKQYPARCHLSQ